MSVRGCLYRADGLKRPAPGNCGMKSISGKELCKVLEKHGWILLRVQGSHHITENLETTFDSRFRFTKASL